MLASLFSTQRSCILPTILTLFALLLYSIVIMSEQDKEEDCLSILRGYVVAAIIVFSYTPNHRYMKKNFFDYQRDRDGANRPRNVLIADRVFQVRGRSGKVVSYGGERSLLTHSDSSRLPLLPSPPRPFSSPTSSLVLAWRVTGVVAMTSYGRA